MTHYSNENIVEQFKQGKFDVLVHGTNCVNIFATGLAKAIKEEWPVVWQDEMRTEEWPLHKLGKSRLNVVGEQWVSTNYIIDLHGHKEQLINYVALEKSLIDLSEQLQTIEKEKGTKLSIGIPQIGQQFVEGDPLFIREIIERVLSPHFTVTIYGKATDEVKDPTLVVGWVVHRGDSLRDGAEAIMRYKEFLHWLKLIRQNAAIVMDIKFYQHSPYEKVLFEHLFLYKPDGTPAEHKGTHIDSNKDRLILRARDYCNEKGLKYVLLLGGGDLLVDLMGYFDAMVVSEIDYQSMNLSFPELRYVGGDVPHIPPKLFKEGRSSFGMLRDIGKETGVITRKVYHRSGKRKADLTDFD